MWAKAAIAVAMLFEALTTLFGSLNKGAKIVDNLASWGEEVSGGFLDNSRAERAAALLELEAKAKATAKALPASKAK